MSIGTHARDGRLSQCTRQFFFEPNAVRLIARGGDIREVCRDGLLTEGIHLQRPAENRDSGIVKDFHSSSLRRWNSIQVCIDETRILRGSKTPAQILRIPARQAALDPEAFFPAVVVI